MYKYSEVEPMKYAYTNGVLLDGSADMQPQRGMVLRADGEKILDIVPEGTDLTGFEIVDLRGGYLMPGLINLHVHLPASGKPKKKASDPKKLVKLITANALTRRIGVKLCEGYAKTELLSGVTTIRTVGGVADFDTIIRDAARRGEILSPRVVASNMAVSVPGGHMAGSLAYEARTPEEAAAFVEKIAAEKPDLIKLMITGGVMDAEVVGEPGVLRMQPALVKAACDKAHALGMQVAAHVESPEGVRVALENGVDSIEHGAKPDEHIMQLCKERGAFQVSTISPAVPYALFDRSISHATYEQQENGKVVFDGIIAMARENLANGIPVGLGTDTGCPYITHYDMWRELCYFVKYCGVTPAFALHTATLLNARLAGIDGETGSIEATGHKCLALPGKNGKITARQIRKAVEEHRANASHEHEVQPGMVYISNPTEVGTLYNKEELTDISAACYELGLYLFVDGARMAYGLTSPANDLSLQDYAALCDVFYLGGTKCGALFGEAVVITNDDLKPDFRYCLKQHGGMLAKGRLLGEQFLALLDGEDGSGSSLYFTMAKKADEQALRIRAAFEAKGCKVLHDSPTNQQFFVLPDEWYDKLAETYAMTHMGKPDKHHTAVRVCTSWATKDEAVEQLIADVNGL